MVTDARDERPTKIRLAEALFEAGLVDLADKAKAGEYDDIESDSAMPITDLMGDLAIELINGNEAARALRQRVMDGDFDATSAEWERWAGEQDFGDE